MQVTGGPGRERGGRRSRMLKLSRAAAFGSCARAPRCAIRGDFGGRGAQPMAGGARSAAGREG
jgi:hypothetical protein